MAQLRLGGLQLVGCGSGLPLSFGQGPGPLRHPGADVLKLAVQPLQLVGPAENAGASAGGAAGHGSAGVEDLAIQSDNAEGILVLPGRGDGGVQILHDGHPPQQIGKDIFVPGVEGDKLVADAHKAGLVFQLLPVLEVARADGADGQNGSPPPVPALQVLDNRLAVLLAVHHDVLHGPAQGGLNGHGVPAGNL